MAQHPSLLQPWLAFLLAGILLRLVTPTWADTATYIVHMDKSMMPTVFSDHHKWYTATLSSLSSSARPTDPLPHLIYAYDEAIHGFSARLTPQQLEQLKTSPGFLSSHRDFPVEVHTTHTPAFLGLNPVSGIWPKSHYGEGAIIGVVDTGVWPESESYRDDGMPEVPSRWKGTCQEGTNFTSSMCNRKLIGARFFNKAALAGNPNLTISVNSARDTDGHGTHTSSTAAGSYVKRATYYGYGTGSARGMAPRAHLAIYKVLWQEGGSAADVLAGIDAAISEGVDVISISLSYGGNTFDENPIAVAAFAAMEKGIFVAHTAGNDGPYYKSVRRGIPWALTVGASTVDRTFTGTVELGDGTTMVGASLYHGSVKSLNNLTLASVDCVNDTQLAENVKNIVVCVGQDDQIDLPDQTYSVRIAKVAGALFSYYRYYTEEFTTSFPAALVGREDGQRERLLDYVNNSTNPTATVRFRNTVLGTMPAPAAAIYSSRGPSLSCPDLLKPDLVAPGSLILASYSPSGDDAFKAAGSTNSFAILYGTSMACPHAAGVAAMLKMVHPDWSTAAIRSAMMTTADVSDKTGGPISDPYRDEFATPLAIGSGQLNPNRALDPGLVYDAAGDDYVRFLCAMNYTGKQIQAIARSNKYKCSGSNSSSLQDLNYPSFIGYFDPDDNNTVRVFRRTVTNVADGAWTYTANVTRLDGFTISVNPRRLVFREKYEKQSFRLRIFCHRKLGDRDVIHGSLNWVDQQGKHVVRSPIVATTHNLPDDDD